MIELIFVIVILGILSAIAIPKFSGVREDAVVTKGQSQVASIRSGIALLKSKKLLEGNTTLPQQLDSADVNGSPLFTDVIVDYPIYAKGNASDNGWMKKTTNSSTPISYEYYISGTPVQFDYNKTTGIFDCTPHTGFCKKLSE